MYLLIQNSRWKEQQQNDRWEGTAATQMVEEGQLSFTWSWETELEEQDQAGYGGEGDKMGGTE